MNRQPRNTVTVGKRKFRYIPGRSSVRLLPTPCPLWYWSFRCYPYGHISLHQTWACKSRPDCCPRPHLKRIKKKKSYYRYFVTNAVKEIWNIHTHTHTRTPWICKYLYYIRGEGNVIRFWAIIDFGMENHVTSKWSYGFLKFSPTACNFVLWTLTKTIFWNLPTFIVREIILKRCTANGLIVNYVLLIIITVLLNNITTSGRSESK